MKKYRSLLCLGIMALMFATVACGSSSQAGLQVSTLTGEGSGFLKPDGVTIALVEEVEVAYITDLENNDIRLVGQDGEVSVVAGVTGTPGYVDGPAEIAEFNEPDGITTDSEGNIYVADTNNNCIRKIDISEDPPMVTTVAGGGPDDPGSEDGAAADARFDGPTGITIDASGNLYVADQNNHTIRKIDNEGDVTTVVGVAGEEGFTDGTADAARLNEPHGLTIDTSGNLYITEWGNNAARVIEMEAGAVSLVQTIAGRDGEFDQPHGIAVNSEGEVFVADENNNEIKKVTQVEEDFEVEVYAGTGEAGDTDGEANNAKFRNPRGLALGIYKGDGHPQDVYVCDYSNKSVRVIKDR